MNKILKLGLYWKPRVLGILFILFVSLFAFDVFEVGLGFWGTLLALLIPLLPSIVMAVGLVLAWRREWVGAAVFALVGGWFLLQFGRDWFSILILGGIPLVIAILFLLGGVYRKQVRG
ncbi:MAG: hypothetical protein AB1846_17930 [Chloroflexota bacterium]